MEGDQVLPGQLSSLELCSHTQRHSSWQRQPQQELSKAPLHSLLHTKQLLEKVVQDVSGQLVGLLQERQGLQEEVDLRCITIEQLLRLAEKRQIQLGTIQMSVVRSCEAATAHHTEAGLG